MIFRPQMVGITGGSCSGKTWLSNRLLQIFGDMACHISLDQFYKDLSAMPTEEREGVNYDHPSAIEWRKFEQVLEDCLDGRTTKMPQYDFSSHTRLAEEVELEPKPIVIVDGLWILAKPRIRRFFDFSIYLRCPQEIRLQRRLDRDGLERGRSKQSVRNQFKKDVVPMQRLFVEPQSRWADLTIDQPVTDDDLVRICRPLRSHLSFQTFEFQEIDNPQCRKVSIHE